jgi:uncharacterized protein
VRDHDGAGVVDLYVGLENARPGGRHLLATRAGRRRPVGHEDHPPTLRTRLATLRRMSEDTQVRDNKELSRYEILIGDTVAGFTEYAVHGNQLDLLHTEVDEAFEGQGIASALIRELLDDIRRRGLAAMPYCPFVRKFVAKHDDYLDLVPAEHRAKFGLAA